jgi:hypothetical protein
MIMAQRIPERIQRTKCVMVGFLKASTKRHEETRLDVADISGYVVPLWH